MGKLSDLSNEDAIIILKHLIKMFQQNGLGEIHEITKSKMRYHEEARDEHIEMDMRKYLVGYIYTAIHVLHNISAEHYDKVIWNLNRFIECENHHRIQGIKLHLSPAERELTNLGEIDLVKLPDYSVLVYGLKELLGESN